MRDAYDGWTGIYWDYDKDKQSLRCYLRVIPGKMGLECAGFPHGISLNMFYDTKEEAKAAQGYYKKFFEAMIEDYKEEDDD